jgi:hypothetical protein
MILASQFGNGDKLKIWQCIDSIPAQIWDYTNQNQIRLRATERRRRSTSSSFQFVVALRNLNTRQTLNALTFPLEGPSTEIACKPSNASLEMVTRSGPLRLKGQRISRRVFRYRDMDSISELALLLSYFFLLFIVISLRLLASLLCTPLQCAYMFGESQALFSQNEYGSYTPQCVLRPATWINSSIEPNTFIPLPA